MKRVRYFWIKLKKYWLAQSIGRLGCLAHGCCNGKPSDSRFGITLYNPLSVAIRLNEFPIGTKLFPVQSILISTPTINPVFFSILFKCLKLSPVPQPI